MRGCVFNKVLSVVPLGLILSLPSSIEAQTRQAQVPSAQCGGAPVCFSLAPSSVERTPSGPRSFRLDFPNGDRVELSCSDSACEDAIRALPISPYAFPITQNNLRQLIEAATRGRPIPALKSEDLKASDLCKVLGGCTPPKPGTGPCGPLSFCPLSMSAQEAGGGDASMSRDAAGNLVLRAAPGGAAVVIPNIRIPGAPADVFNPAALERLSGVRQVK